MPGFVFAVPVLPGKDPRAPADALRGREAEYEESRARHGVTMERAYEQPTPMGTLVVAYIESERGFAETMAALAGSDLAVDRDFMAALRDVHGFDPAEMSAAPPPEVVGEWWDEEAPERQPGLAFCAPLLPGRTDAARAFIHEAFVTRRDELAAAWRELGLRGEVCTIVQTPQGDMTCVYVEGPDPERSNRLFAASQSPFMAWYRAQLMTVLPPGIDFNEAMPAMATIWDWHRVPTRA